MSTSPRLEVVSPRTGQRCPAWLEPGECVAALCGALSPVVTVWVVYRPENRAAAFWLAAHLGRLGHPVIMEEVSGE